MGKLLSERERKLQRKLIPLNIFVCILCLTAVFTIIFAPFLTVDFGKILRHEAMLEFVEKAMDDVVDGSTENNENGEVGSTEVDFMPVIASIVTNVLQNAEGSITVSGYAASKIAFSSGEDKGQKVLDEFFFNDDALVMRLVDSVADGVANMFKSDAGKSLIEEVVVESIANSLVEKLAEGTAASNLKAENITDLTKTLKKLGTAEGDEGVDAVADEFVDQLKVCLGDDFNEDTDGERVRDYIKEMYEDTAEANDGAYTFEAMISITISQNVDLKNYNINGLFGKKDEEQPEGSAKKRAVAGEVEGDEGEGPVDPPTGGNETEDGYVICTTYEQILDQLGLGGDNTELKANLKAALHDMVDGYVSDYSDYMGYYAYTFYGMLGLAAPWLILFLFSFFHMIAKNKRFMMWYVKLFGFIPTLVSTVIFAGKLAVKYGWLENALGEGAGLISALIGGLSSLMWIVTICYTLLWLVSVCWAFPIKHKIRKERKLVKTYGGSDDYTGGGKKTKKEKKKKRAKSSGSYSYQTETHEEKRYGYDDDNYDYGGFNAPYYGDDYYKY